VFLIAFRSPSLGSVWPPIPPTSALITETVIFMSFSNYTLIYSMCSFMEFFKKIIEFRKITNTQKIEMVIKPASL
jgi:hypothetical protein